MLRRAGLEMPAVTRYAVRLSLETLEWEGLARCEGEQWFYAPEHEPIQQRLF